MMSSLQDRRRKFIYPIPAVDLQKKDVPESQLNWLHNQVRESQWKIILDWIILFQQNQTSLAN
jgi:hypothetical protein